MMKDCSRRGGIDRLLHVDTPIGAFGLAIACTIILVIAFALRLPGLGRSLWLDEAYTAWFSDVRLAQLWTVVPSYETHPPLYYSLVKGWSQIFGRSEAALRSLSVLASLATVLLLALSGRILKLGPAGDRVALLAALLLSVNAGNIHYAREARPYALETLTAAIAILSSVILVRSMARHSHIGNYRFKPLLPTMLTLAVAAGLTLWLHDTGIFIAFGLWTGLILSLLLFVRGSLVWKALAIAFPGVIALLIWMPFLPTFLSQSSGVADGPFWIQFQTRDLISAWYLVSGGEQPLLLIIPLCLLGLAICWRNERPVAMLLTIILLLPLGSVLAISYLLKPIFIDRLFEWMAPVVLCLTAFGIVFGLRRTGPRLIATSAVIVFALLADRSYYNTPTENWRGLVDTIHGEMRPGDLIVASPNEINPALAYYAAGRINGADILYVPAPFPALNLPRPYIGNRGAPAIVESDGRLVSGAIADRKRVWLIERRSDLYDPDGIVRAAMSARHKPQKVLQSQGILVTLFE